jgi:hypothetical protein
MPPAIRMFLWPGMAVATFGWPKALVGINAFCDANIAVAGDGHAPEL